MGGAGRVSVGHKSTRKYFEMTCSPSTNQISSEVSTLEIQKDCCMEESQTAKTFLALGVL